MANEISLSLSLTVTKGNYTRTVTDSQQYTQNTQGESSGVLATSTTKASIPLGSVATPGHAYFKNLDATNNIDIGADDSGTFVAFCTLKPNEEGYFRVKSTATIQAKAAASTPNLLYVVWSD